MSLAENTQSYRQTVRELSERLVEAQRPIRILDAIKWDATVQRAFFESGCRELPPVDRRYYEERALPFDPVAKRQELHDLERTVLRKLGQFNPIGVILRRMSREYRVVVRLLESRGLPEFAAYSQQLYGSAGDVFHAGDPTLADLGDMMSEALTNISQCPALNHEEKTISGDEAVAILQERLSAAFPDPQRPIRVMLSDNIVSDAAAGADYLKIRREARFTLRDLRLLEVHEGWVHLGTTLNGLAQPVCTFLSKGPPSATVTQEGLAIVMEVLAFASHPNRLRRVTNRIRGVRMAEEGANFLEVFDFFRTQGDTDEDAYANCVRVFRGSTPQGGPFTKDLSYSKGFILVYNFLRLAVRKGKLERIPLLFCGKATLEDIGVFAQLADEGILAAPRYVPAPFADLNALCAWMCYSNFLNRLDLNRAEADFASLL
jgi:uncharacterized protein (TIGR02421 family)